MTRFELLFIFYICLCDILSILWTEFFIAIIKINDSSNELLVKVHEKILQMHLSICI